MEYCPRGTLDVMLHHSAAARWDAAKLVSMVRSIARGMLHLHTRKPPMLHRDLKPGNIFVGEAACCKLQPCNSDVALQGSTRKLLTLHRA